MFSHTSQQVSARAFQNDNYARVIFISETGKNSLKHVFRFYFAAKNYNSYSLKRLQCYS